MGVKYRLNYTEFKTNNNIRVDIDVPSYSGEILTVRGVGGNACTIEYDGGNGDDVFEDFIVGSQATISILQGGVVDVEELQLADDLTVRVRKYDNDVLNWSGFLVPDGIQSPIRGHVNYELNLTATDGLKSSDGINFMYTNPQGINIDGYVSEIRCPLNMIRQALNNIGNVLPIRWSCAMKSVIDGSKDFFAGVVCIDSRGELVTYNDINCQWLIENIVKSVNCKIFQEDGYWYIESFVDKIRNNGTLDYWEIDGVMTNVTARKITLNRNVTNLIEINDDAYLTRQKGYGKVSVEYKCLMNENIMPNGSFNIVGSSSLVPLYYSGINASLETDGALNNRIEDKFGLEERSVKYLSTGTNSEMSLTDWLCLDAKTLFPRFNLGFILEPINYTTKTVDGQSLIDWDLMPLKLQVSYTATRNGITEDYYMNENGYWIRDVGTNFRIESMTKLNGDNGDKQVVFVGRGVNGQYIDIQQPYQDAWGIELAQYRCDITQTFDTVEDTVTFLVNTYNLERGGVANSIIFRAEERPAGELIINVRGDSGVTTVNYIPLIVDKALNGDIIQIQFTSKGSDSRITIPEPDSLNGVGDYGQGHLKIKFMQENGKQCRLDDFYINVDSNNDVYTVENEMSKNSLGEYELEISSSFSGFFQSSYMKDYANSDRMMLFNKNGSACTLTEHFAREIINWRSRAMIIYNGTILGKVKMGDYITLHNRKFVPLSISYNSEINQSTVVLFEANYSNLEYLTVKHKGSNEDIIR